MQGKNIVVVGGNSGIGRVLVEKLVNTGANVFAFGRKQEDFHPQVNFSFWDVTEGDPSTEHIPEIIDGFVYLPGTINLKPFHRFKPEEFELDYQVNVKGAVTISQKLINQLKKVSPASMVFVSTVAAKLGMPFHSSIAMAKSALEGLAKSIAAEYAPKIRANVVAPSLTNTPLAERLLSTDERKEASANRHPLKRVGNPKDIANAIFFLLSDESSWMTGQVIGVDGGMGEIKQV